MIVSRARGKCLGGTSAAYRYYMHGLSICPDYRYGRLHESVAWKHQGMEQMTSGSGVVFLNAASL